MQPEFWLQKWQNNEIGFHEGAPNDLLVRHFAALSVPHGGRVLVPLCGKSHDMAWVRAAGFDVVGVELSRLAVEQFFAERGLSPQITKEGHLERFSAEGVTIFACDVFALDKATLGKVDAIHDRAAMVALPETLRPRYTQHLIALTDAAPVFLVTFVYDQSSRSGPPFSVDAAEVAAHYAATHQITEAESREVPGGLRDATAAAESAWLLTRPD